MMAAVSDGVMGPEQQRHPARGHLPLTLDGETLSAEENAPTRELRRPLRDYPIGGTLS
jgi:hypothetical protein